MKHLFTLTFKKLCCLIAGVFLINCLGLLNAAAQIPFDTTTVVPKKASGPYEVPPPKKNFKRAAGELLLAELIPFTYDRYIAKADFAMISFKSVGYNLSPAHWEWDNDSFKTNQFAHPYHGSLYYSAFRTNGFNFWQSGAATVAGSYLWETFAEVQPPSPNDFINTSFGGIVLGETTYRLANKLVNNRRRGFRRQASEVAALLINPMNGLNRIINGQWGRVYGNTKEEDSSRVSVQFDLGSRTFSTTSNSILKQSHTGWFARASLVYGTPYEEYKKPFSNINITAEFGNDDSTALNVLSVYGSLAGWNITEHSRIKSLAILSANYDYLQNIAFFYGGQSVKLNILSEFVITDKVKLNTTAGGGIIVLSAIPSAYKLENGRNYDYGPGLAINAGGKLSMFDKLFFGLNYRGGWTKTINGNNSNYFLHTVTAELAYKVLKDLSISAEPGYFALEGNYDDHPDINKKYPYLRASARYNFNLY